MLDKRLNLFRRHSFPRYANGTEHVAEQLLHELKVLLGLGAVDGLQTDVTLRVGLHVGQGSGQGEQRGGRRVLGEVANGAKEEPEI